MEFTNGCGPGNTLQRQLVLTEEGVLVIVDTFTPGREVEGWTGGQLWPLYALQERVSDWFASASDGAYPQRDGSTAERRMLVKFMTAEDVTIGVERIRPSAMHALEADGRRHDEFYTTYSRVILKACQPVTAALVVLPLKPAEDVAQRAGGVYLEQRPNEEVSTTLALPGKREPLTLLVCVEDVAIDRRGR